MRRARRAARGGPRRREPGAGHARRGRGREDGAAGVLRVEQASGFASRGRSGVESEMELAFAGAASAVRADARPARRGCPAPQREALRDRVRPARRAAAGPVPRRAGGAEPALRGRRGAAAAVRRRRRAVARSGVGADARVRRAAAAGGAGRDRVRGPRGRGAELAGLPELAVDGLRDGDARALLALGACPVRLDERVRDRIVAETRGQPAGAARAAARADGGAAGRRVRAARARRRCRGGSRRASCAGSRRCPSETRRLLLVAAAEPVGDPLLLWRAAERLGIRLARRAGGGRRAARRSASA